MDQLVGMRNGVVDGEQPGHPKCSRQMRPVGDVLVPMLTVTRLGVRSALNKTLASTNARASR
jgi:hypothetical protein